MSQERHETSTYNSKELVEISAGSENDLKQTQLRAETHLLEPVFAKVCVFYSGACLFVYHLVSMFGLVQGLKSDGHVVSSVQSVTYNTYNPTPHTHTHTHTHTHGQIKS